MNELNKLLTDAKISPAITIQDRLNQLQTILGGIGTTELRIKGCEVKIRIREIAGLDTDELDKHMENLVNTLRCLKNDVRRLAFALNKAANTEY